MTRDTDRDLYVKKLITDFVEAICDLAKANRKTGLWDHMRFEECKKPFSEVDSELIYLSEKNSRQNVEERAVQRKVLDKVLQKLLLNAC